MCASAAWAGFGRLGRKEGVNGGVDVICAGVIVHVPIEVMESYLRGDKLRTCPFLILISPAADIREPCRKEEC